MSEDLSKEIIIYAQEQVFRDLYEKYYHRLCFYASRYLKEIETAEDVVQEIFVGLWEKKLRFPNETVLNAFLYTSVYNACINKLSMADRHFKHHERISKQLSETEHLNYDTGRIEDEVVWKIFSAVDTLPKECQKIFKLSYLDGLPQQEVADQLRISVHTVKSQRARAKKLLQQRLQHLYPFCLLFFFS